MENASKALIMAATILISVAIVSLGVYLFTYFGSYAKGVEDQNRTNQIAKFNSQFLSYEGKDLTIYDAITIANAARDYNEKNELRSGQTGYITVTGPGGIDSRPGNTNDISEMVKRDNSLIYNRK